MKLNYREIARAMQPWRRNSPMEDVRDAISSATVVLLERLTIAEKSVDNIQAFVTTVARRILSNIERQRRVIDSSDAWDATRYMKYEQKYLSVDEEAALDDQFETTMLMESLPIPYADVLRRRYLDGYSFEEISAETGISAACLRQRHARALRAARKILSAHEVNDGHSDERDGENKLAQQANDGAGESAAMQYRQEKGRYGQTCIRDSKGRFAQQYPDGTRRCKKKQKRKNNRRSARTKTTRKTRLLKSSVDTHVRPAFEQNDNRNNGTKRKKANNVNKADGRNKKKRNSPNRTRVRKDDVHVLQKSNTPRRSKSLKSVVKDNQR